MTRSGKAIDLLLQQGSKTPMLAESALKHRIDALQSRRGVAGG
jgi:hypothetical protein